METEITRSTSVAETPLTELIRDLSVNAKELVVEQGRLLSAEFGVTVREVSSDLRDLLLLSALAVVAVLPFMLFLIFGLGEILGGRLWLSSLIVTVFWGGGAGWLAYRQYQQLLRKKTTLPSTRRVFERSAETVKESFDEVKDAVEQTV